MRNDPGGPCETTAETEWISVSRALCALCLSLLFAPFSRAQGQPQVEIRMMASAAFGIPDKDNTSTNAVLRRAVFDEFHRQNPGIRVVNAGGLPLAGDNDDMFLMAMAGSEPPDVFYVNFRQYYTYLDQGFCRPLDDLIAPDPASIARVNPTIQKVLRSYDGHIYAMPFFQVALGLYYRKDFFVQAGLDPAKPPRNWDEFYEDCKKLTRDGHVGFAFSTPPGYHWSDFLYQAGGEVVKEDADGNWHSAVASPAGVTAIQFFRKLVLDTWIGPDGKREGPAATISTNWQDDKRLGKTAMWFDYTTDVVLQSYGDLPASLVGIGAMPAGPAGHKNEINAGMWAINADVKDPAKLAACWKFIRYMSGDDAARVSTDKAVELGLGSLVNPLLLKKFGYSDLLGEVDPEYVKANEQLFTTGHPEPYGRNCQQVYSVLDDALDDARLNPHKPAMTILKNAEQAMNQKLIGYIPEDQMARDRGWATGILIGFVLTVFGSLIAWWRRSRTRNPEFKIEERLPAGISRRRMILFMSICLAPAIVSLLVWSYYPLARGLTIAFQDYKVVQPAKWVGVDNFIGVFTQPVFYRSIANSFIYTGLTILIGFFIPIVLAIALNEIPRLKVFFRTVFYLPAMTSSILIAFVWTQFYDKSKDGLLNSLLAPVIEHVVNPVWHGWFHFAPVPAVNDWLGNPSLAIFAVVLPGVWAGAGPGSILYLAALKNISEERYEAADIDGANWYQKILHITLPGLKPLMLINLLGVFIGSFKAAENILVMTNGGPLNATRTIGLEVWQNAFMYLKFGYATAAAWVMGAILIGFTLIQIRSLTRMKFSTAKS
ncbi:MAG TPA: extracellular solute-binding protein [Fimbriimonadaceae bacterium]|nr:extracellular solute-binding protein [Fimbriimonadaceae bacterium]